MVSERLATSNFKMTTSSELRLFTETLQQNNNLLAEEEAKFLPHAQHHKETQDKFLLPPQHHTPDSVLQLLSSVLPLLSVYTFSLLQYFSGLDSPHSPNNYLTTILFIRSPCIDSIPWFVTPTGSEGSSTPTSGSCSTELALRWSPPGILEVWHLKRRDAFTLTRWAICWRKITEIPWTVFTCS